MLPFNLPRSISSAPIARGILDSKYPHPPGTPVQSPVREVQPGISLASQVSASLDTKLGPGPLLSERTTRALPAAQEAAVDADEQDSFDAYSESYAIRDGSDSEEEPSVSPDPPHGQALLAAENLDEDGVEVVFDYDSSGFTSSDTDSDDDPQPDTPPAVFTAVDPGLYPAPAA